jgi:hypothetical protein
MLSPRIFTTARHSRRRSVRFAVGRSAFVTYVVEEHDQHEHEHEHEQLEVREGGRKIGDDGLMSAMRF